MMGFDKMQAIRGGRRIPEAKLFTVAMAGGAVGGLLGMQIWRHKTKKPAFHCIFWMAAMIHVYIAYTYLPIEF